MANVIDITDKLQMDENPVLKIGELEVTINADAKSVLKMMPIIESDDMGNIDKAMKCYDLLFSKGDRQKIDALKLSFVDLQKVIETAIDVAVGVDEDDEQGEEQNHTTT